MAFQLISPSDRSALGFRVSGAPAADIEASPESRLSVSESNTVDYALVKPCFSIQALLGSCRPDPTGSDLSATELCVNHVR